MILLWELKYYRYGALKKYEDETKAGALSFGVWQSEEGQLSMYELIDPNGKIAMNREELKQYWFNYNF